MADIAIKKSKFSPKEGLELDAICFNISSSYVFGEWITHKHLYCQNRIVEATYESKEFLKDLKLCSVLVVADYAVIPEWDELLK